MSCVALNRRGDPSRYHTHASALTPNPCQSHKMHANSRTPLLGMRATPARRSQTSQTRPTSPGNGADAQERAPNAQKRARTLDFFPETHVDQAGHHPQESRAPKLRHSPNPPPQNLPNPINNRHHSQQALAKR